jgi:hypothetical protein
MKDYFKVAVASSDNFSSEEAVTEVLIKCKFDLDNHSPNAGIVFMSIYQDHEVILNEIMREFPDLELIGCTHDGVLSSNTSYDEDAITLTLISSNVVDMYSGAAVNVSENLERNIKDALEPILKKSNNTPQLSIATFPSLTASGVNILEEMKKTLGQNFPIIGGAAADDWNFKETFQFHKNKIYKDTLPFLVFFGPLKYAIGVNTGWTGKGEKAKVQQSAGNVVYKIGDKTAVEYFQHYLGENITPLGEYPLLVYEGEDQQPYLRAALQSDYEAGTLFFAGDVPENAMVQIGFTDRDKIIEASKKSILDSLDKYPGKNPEVAMCFSCSARKQVLGTRTGEEYSLISEQSPQLKISGFYGYGEISPLKDDSTSRFHNETFISLILGIE